MGKLQSLLKEAQKGKDIQEKVYGRFPFEVAEMCGPDEVEDIIHRLDELFLEKEGTEEWDGDTLDDIWRAQKNYSGLLERLTQKYTKEICKGLKSNYPETRFWVSSAFEKAPNADAVSYLAEYLLNEMPEHHRSLGLKALNACKKKRSLISKLFNKNA